MNISELKEKLVNELQTEVAGLGIEFGEKKLILTVNEEGVQGKTVDIVTKKRVRHKLSKSVSDKIKQAKTFLKNKLDTMYLYTLLAKTEGELKKFDVNTCDKEARELVIETVLNVEKLCKDKTAELLEGKVITR